MRFALPAAILLAIAALMPSPAVAQSAIPANPRIVVDYIDPRKPGLEPLMERLKKRGALEELSQFLSPLKLPRTLRLKAKQCNTVNAFYDPQEWAIIFCYEYLEALDNLAPKQTTPDGITRNDIVVGGFIDTMLHELGHALFDILSVPLLGREEDAADQLSAFLMLQFGRDVARMAIKGGAYWYKQEKDPAELAHYAGEHGTGGQRFFNYFCIAYGGFPEAFQDFVDKGILPKSRAANCANEYRQVERAFVQTILPHIDQDMMKKVQAHKWLSVELDR